MEIQEKIELKPTHTIWDIMDEDGYFLKPLDKDNGILMEVSDDGEDGTYPRPSDYVRCVNSLDKEGTSYWLNRTAGKKNKLDFKFCGINIIRGNKWDDEAILEFPESIPYCFGMIGSEPVIRKVKKLEGTFEHEYYWRKNGRQNKVANGFEIWFNINKIIE